jgi:hypothetical protein
VTCDRVFVTCDRVFVTCDRVFVTCDHMVFSGKGSDTSAWHDEQCIGTRMFSEGHASVHQRFLKMNECDDYYDEYLSD